MPKGPRQVELPLASDIASEVSTLVAKAAAHRQAWLDSQYAELDRLERAAKRPDDTRRQPLDIIRDYICSGGRDGVSWHGCDFFRWSIHAQELGDHLARNGWPGAAERLDAIFRRLAAEGLVKRRYRSAPPPPWCSAYDTTTGNGADVPQWAYWDTREEGVPDEPPEDASVDPEDPQLAEARRIQAEFDAQREATSPIAREGRKWAAWYKRMRAPSREWRYAEAWYVINAVREGKGGFRHKRRPWTNKVPRRW